MVRAGSQSVSTLTGPAAKSPTPSPESTEALNFMALHRNTDDPPQEGRVGRGVARSTPTTNKDRRTAVSPFRSLPELHPHEVELRVAVKDLSRDVAPEKFRSKAKSVGGFVFGLLVFPQGTKSAPEHARKNRPGKKDDDKDKDKDKDKKDDKDDEKSKVNRTKKEKEKVKAALLKEVPKEKDNADKDDAKKEDGKDKKDTRWISAFVEARPTEDYPAHWFFEDVQFLVSLINFQDLKKSIVKHDKHTFSPVESSDGKAIDRGWHDFVHCDEGTLRSSGFVDPKDDTVCFRASVYLAGGAMKVNSKTKSRYMSLSKIDPSLNEKVPTYLNSLVQVWYHLGLFRNAIYSASITNQLSGMKKSNVLPALREIFVRLQHRALPASCSPLCSAFGRKGWSKLCKADPDFFCTEIFQCLGGEFIPSAEVLKAEEAAVKAAAKAKGKAKAMPRVVEVPLENRALWETVEEMFQFEVEWIAQAVDGGEFSDSSVYQGPCFTLVVRGFTCLEDTLDHYFSPRIIEDGGLRVKTMRKFRRMPNVLQWCLKRGDYDCCTGLSGVTETYLSFPRQIDMGKYSEGAGLYHLYAIVVECDDHFLSYIRPEMEGDRGQWYRFDERETSCGVSNATAVDSSYGGEEWLCVNYLYGPSAVLKRPRESRASMLIYAKDEMLRTLLREPRLPKLCPELHMPLQREIAQAGSVELEAANRAEAELLEDLDAEALAEVRKKKAKQKKKQKEKQIKEQKKARVEEPEAANEGKDEVEESEEEEEEEPTPPKAVLEEVPVATQESDDEGFEESRLVARGKKTRSAKAKAGPAETNKNNKKKEISSGAYPASAKLKEEPEREEIKSASEGRRSPRSSDAGSTAGSQPAAKGAGKAEPKSMAAQTSQAKATVTVTPSEGTAKNVANGPRLNGNAQFAPRVNGASPSKPMKAELKAQREPLQSQASPQAQHVQPHHVQQAQHVQQPQHVQQAQHVQQPQHVQQAQHVQQPQHVQQAQHVQQPQHVQQAQHVQPQVQQVPSQPQHVQQAQHVQQVQQPQQPQPGAASASTSQNRAPPITHANSVSSVATTAEMGVEGERPHPSSSSRSWPTDDGMKVYPEQLIGPAGGTLEDYAQFICGLCNLVSRHPCMMRGCAHIFCANCFKKWVDKTKPSVVCPTCRQAVTSSDVVQLETATAPGLALCYRLYSGMKVRCVYHSDVTGELNEDHAKAKDRRLSCSWTGALLDFQTHLGNCQVHSAVCERSKTSRGGESSASASQPTPQHAPAQPMVLRGMCLATEDYQAPGTLAVQRGMRVWVNETEQHPEWVSGQRCKNNDFTRISDPAWVPRCFLKPALYLVRSPWECEKQGVPSSYLPLRVGEVVTVESLQNGWSYGRKMVGGPYYQPEESGWYPQACIGDPIE